MKDTYRALLSILVTALMAAGGLLAASATSTVDGGAAAPRAWAPKDRAWT